MRLEFAALRVRSVDERVNVDARVVSLRAPRDLAPQDPGRVLIVEVNPEIPVGHGLTVYPLAAIAIMAPGGGGSTERHSVARETAFAV